MNLKSKGKEFYRSLPVGEKEVLKVILELENTEERLLSKTSTKTQREIKKIIEANADKWGRENDN